MRSVKQNIATPDIAELRDELRRVGEMLAILVKTRPAKAKQLRPR